MPQYPPGFRPSDDEAERASTAYLMSLMAMAVGVFLPIVNLIATVIFFLQQRRQTYFVRWHCTQALLSQLSVLPVNSALIWWTLSIAFGPRTLSDAYLAFVMTVLIIDAFELSATIRAAVATRRGAGPYWWCFGPLTDLLCRD